MELDSPIQDVKGVGKQLSSKFNKLGIHTIADLISYYPKYYEDYSKITDIAKLKTGKHTIKAKINQVSGRYVRRGMHITEAIASDETGSARLIWFNQPYRAKAIISNKYYLISGDFELRYQKFAMQNPSCELEGDLPVNSGRILPKYRETKGLKSNQIRKVIKNILPLINSTQETLPGWIIKSNKLISRSKALYLIHYPKLNKDIEAAKARLGFEEVFELTLSALIIKQLNSTEKALKIKFDLNLAKDFIGHLPFKLTDDQRRVLWSIYKDLEKDIPMNRLLEGDVGSGKTVVATMAALMSLKQGYQVALMAPTEILAKQHADTIHSLLKPLGMEDRVGLLIGKMSSKSKAISHSQIKSGNMQFIIGTHALIQEKVDIKKLSLIIIDEQHRFGVEQRKKLIAKAGHMPHVLTMTATPIPRSLTLTLYGEMDVSLIKQKPENRKPIITEICSPNSRDAVYDKIITQLKAGRQAFVVCPLILDSEVLKGLRSAEVVYKELKQGYFKDWRVGLLHGKQKTDEKSSIMQDFIDKKLDILVSTTVIEVGVDVPNANVMLIENADRFGLAQLHQLRGRIGRGEHQSHCYLMQTDSQAPTRRLRAIEGTNDGFKLSELDLDIRGPGAIYGTAQHGALDLSIAKLTDVELIATARNTAKQFIEREENLVQYSHLASQVNKLLGVTNLN